jgi:5'-3' exoribonuclease 1
MGVPYYFKWLIDTYNQKDTLIKHDYPYDYVDELYIDMNGCIHKAGREETINNLTEMFKAIIDYLDKIVNKINPQKVLYIGIDGVAPGGKLFQQRKRRYKSFIDTYLTNKVLINYNEKPIKNKFDFNMISPGTKFMYLLDIELNKYFKVLNNKRPNLKIVFSNSNETGEGEHKLIQYIKQNSTPTSNCVVYGLDGDLIFLCLFHYQNNICLFRENVNKKDPSEFIYFLIKPLYTLIIESLENKNKSLYNCLPLNKNSIIRDYTYISFFLGNDFLPNLSYLKINTNGINKIIDNYKKIQYELNDYLTRDDFTINITFLKLLIFKLKEHEDREFQYNTRKNHTNRKRFLESQQYLSSFGKEKELLVLKQPGNFIKDCLNLGYDDWRTNYYDYYFGIKPTEFDKIMNICFHYFKTLIWNLKYYNQDITDWNYYYPYRATPLLSDIYQFLTLYDINTIKFETVKPITPIQLLFLILPIESKDLLPTSLQFIFRDYSDYYIPIDKIELDYQNHSLLWECSPIFPLHNLKLQQQLLKTVETTCEKLNITSVS